MFKSNGLKYFLAWGEEDVDMLADGMDIELSEEEREEAIDLAEDYLNNNDWLNTTICEIIMDAIRDAKENE